MLIPLEQFNNGRHILRIDKLLKDDMTGVGINNGKALLVAVGVNMISDYERLLID